MDLSLPRPLRRERSHRSRVTAVTSASGGFTLIETVVVLVIIAILTGVFLQSQAFQKNRGDAGYAAAASTIWDGVLLYRRDHSGTFPPASEVASGTFVDANGDRYVPVPDWPDDPRTGTQLSVGSGGATPPLTSTPNTVVYYAGGNPATTASIAAYGGRGTIVYRRVISTGGLSWTTQGPLG